MIRTTNAVTTFFFIIIMSLSYSSAAAGNNSSATGLNDSLLDRIIARGTLRVGTTVDYKPFSYANTAGVQGVAGLDIDLAQNLADSLGVSLVIVKTSWPTLMADLAHNKYDIGMSGITITLERQQQAFFSVPMMSSGKAAIARNEDANKYRTIAAINTKGTRVIVNPGGTNEKFARAHFPNATIIENGENLSVFTKIRDGKADVMVTDAIETIIQSEIHPELVAVNPDQPFNYFELGYLLPRDVIFKAYVDQWLSQLKSSGDFDRMHKAALSAVVAQAKAQQD